MSSQTVYFTNPAIISGLVNGSTSMSGSISTLQQQITTVCVTGSFTAQANFRYQYTLPFKWSGSVVTVVCTLPASPADGATVTLVDGNYFYGWGNTFYNCRVDGNGKAIVGNLQQIVGGTTSNLFKWRGQTIQLVYSASQGVWNSTAQGNAISKEADPYTGWWECMTRIWNPDTANFKPSQTAFLTIDATQYPIVVQFVEGMSKDNLMKLSDYTMTCYEATGPSVSNPYSRYLARILGSYVLGGPESSFANNNVETLCFVGASYNYIGITYGNNASRQARGAPLTTYRRIDNLANSSVNEPNPFQPIDLQGGEFFGQSLLDPVWMIKKYFEQMEYNMCIGNSNLQTYAIDYYSRQQALEDLLSPQGLTFEVPIEMVRRSHYCAGNNNWPNYWATIPTGSTLLTDICCSYTHYATPGSNVTISGFTGDWTDLNGEYINGVSWVDWNSSKHNDRRIDFVYTGPATKSSKIITGSATGTAVMWLNKFVLIKDTVNHTGCYETGPYKGFNNVSLGSPKVTVTHKVYKNMPPNEWIAAYKALALYCYGTQSIHDSHIVYFSASNRLGQIISTWSGLNSGFSAPGFTNPTNGKASPMFRNVKSEMNSYLTDFGITYPAAYLQQQQALVNDPYEVAQFITNKQYAQQQELSNNRGTAWFNYCETGTLKGLYCAFDGSAPVTPIQQYFSTTINKQNKSNPAIIGGTTIVGELFALPQPYATGSQYYPLYSHTTGPNSSIWIAGNTTTAFSSAVANPDVVVGKIRSELVGGKTAMYLSINQFANSNIAQQMGSNYKDFAPSGFTGPAELTSLELWGTRGAQYQLWSVISKYMNSFTGSTGAAGPDIVIVDIRSCIGGQVRFDAFMSMFGADRFGITVDNTNYFDDGYSSAVINPQTSTGSSPYWTSQVTNGRRFSTPNDAIYNEWKLTQEKIRPQSIMEANFGSNAVIKNCNVVVLVDGATQSGGELAYAYFYGDDGSKNLGNGVKVNIIGERFDGIVSYFSSSNRFTFPVNSRRTTRTSFPQFYLDRGNIMTFSVPTGALAGKAISENITSWNNNSIPTGPNRLVGTAVETALPSDMSCLLYNYGFLEAPANFFITQSRSAPSTSDASTWRDAWLEQAIRQGQYM